MDLDWAVVLAWLARNRGKAIGAGVGLIVGLLFIILGFWRGLFLTLCIGVGWFLGSRADKNESFSELIERLLPPGE